MRIMYTIDFDMYIFALLLKKTTCGSTDNKPSKCHHPTYPALSFRLFS
jgi:hypothetical protein